MEIMTGFIFLSSKITAVGDCSHEFKGYLLLGRKADKPRQHIKKHRHYFADKGLSSQSYNFPSSHVWMWELDYKESESESHSVVSDPLWPYRLYSPWNSPGQNTVVGSCSLLQGILPSPGDLPNPGIKSRSPALQADSLPTELSGKPW